MKTKFSILSIINSLLGVGLLISLFVFWSANNKSTTVYVDNVVLFSKFNLANDLKSMHMEELKQQKTKIDSLVAVLQGKDTAQEPDEALNMQYVNESRKLQQMESYLSQDLNEKVWSRLNTYIKEYGETHNYDIIMGTQGNGTIMFGTPELDITEKIIEYANNKYEGA